MLVFPGSINFSSVSSHSAARFQLVYHPEQQDLEMKIFPQAA